MWVTVHLLEKAAAQGHPAQAHDHLSEFPRQFITKILGAPSHGG